MAWGVGHIGWKERVLPGQHNEEQERLCTHLCMKQSGRSGCDRWQRVRSLFRLMLTSCQSHQSTLTAQL